MTLLRKCTALSLPIVADGVSCCICICMYVWLFGGYVRLLCRCVWLYCGNVRLFCGNIWLFFCHGCMCLSLGQIPHSTSHTDMFMCRRTKHTSAKEPYIFAKEPYVRERAIHTCLCAQQRSITPQKNHIYSRKSHIFAKEPYIRERAIYSRKSPIFAKEPYIRILHIEYRMHIESTAL